MSFGRNDMTPAATKRAIRIEKKKKKMAAYLEISRLNEYDRVVKSARTLEAASEDLQAVETEPIPKRLRTSTGADNKVDDTTRYAFFKY